MKSVNEMIGYIQRCISSEKKARRKHFGSSRSILNVEAVEQRLLLAADLTGALYDVAVLQEIDANETVASYFLHFDTAQDTAQLAQDTGASAIEASEFVTNGYTLDFDQAITVQNAADAFSTLPGFDYLHPNIAIQYNPYAVPNDPLYVDQWHLSNTGQGGGVAGVDANIESVWDNYTGQGVTIGIVDDSVETAHEDFAGNINTSIDFDWNDNDLDPSPVAATDNHGTSVAGVAAARGDNNLGVAGAAYEAELVGLRLIAGPITDRDIAEALTHESGIIDIYNNSWGPGNIFRTNFIGPQTAGALRDSAINGRSGLGTIQVFAAGNSGLVSNVNYNALTKSRYTIAVAALANTGARAGYSTPGAAVVVAAPSNGGTLGITTTDRTGSLGYSPTNYANDFGGTSSAAPLVSGIVALMLEANPNLTYRDVTDILAHTSERVDPTNADWTQNGGGLWVNHEYGFGAIDAAAAVSAAVNHIPLSTEISFSTGTQIVNQAIPDNGTAVTATVDVAATDGIDSLEYVEVVLNATHEFIGDLEIILTSPSGTQSILAETRATDPGTAYANYVFSTVHHWDESSAGTWTLSVRDGAAADVGTFTSFSLNFYGTGVPAIPILVETGAGTTVTDSGLTDTFDVVLPVQPASNVVLDVVSGDTSEVTVSTSQLTFTPANWNVRQTVTLTGVIDRIGDGDQMSDVVVSVVTSQSDSVYAAAPDGVVNVTSIDDDEFLPAKPVVTGPTGIVAVNPPTATWTVATNALRYNVTVTNVFTNVVVQQHSVLVATSLTFPTPFLDGVYRIVVAGVNSIGQVGPSSDPVIFGVGDQLELSAPVIVSPVIGTTVTNPLTPIVWSPVPGANNYELYVKTVNGVTRYFSTGTADGNGNLSDTPTTAYPEGNVTVWIRAFNPFDEAGPWSTATRFLVNAMETPTKPIITSPLIATTTNPFPLFSWIGDGDTYELWVAKRRTGTGTAQIPAVYDRVIYRRDQAELSYTHFLALENGDYRVWVRATNSAGEKSVWSDVEEFTVGVPTPAKPNLFVSVSSNNSTPTFSWETTGAAYGNGTTFDLWVNNLSTGLSQAVRNTTLTGSSYQLPTDLPQGRYRAWLRATSGVGSSSGWSSPVTFDIDVLAPGRPTVTGPVAAVDSTDGLIQTETPTFTWTSTPGAVRYELWVNHLDSRTTRIVHETQLTSAAFTPLTNLPQGAYKAWVRAFNIAGEVGEWSSPFTFALNVPTPSTPVITAPVQNAVGSVDDATPTIRWTPSTGSVATYDLQLENTTTGTRLIDVGNIVSEEYTTLITLDETAYRVRVRGVNSVGETSDWSDWYAFRVDVPNATTPVPVAPIGTVTSDAVTFEWQHTSGNIRYEILVRDLLRQESIVIQMSTTELNLGSNTAVYTHNGFADGTYRWWVRAFNSQDTASSWSNSQTFNVDAQARLDEQPTAPDNDLQIILASLGDDRIEAQMKRQEPADQPQPEAIATITANPADRSNLSEAFAEADNELLAVIQELADPSANLLLVDSPNKS